MAEIPPVPGSERRPPSRSGDVLAGPADYSRPANPWPRLIAFGLGVLAVVFMAGLCVVSFADVPEREVRVRTTELEPGIPKFIAIPAFGHDMNQRTFGAYLAVPADLSDVRALLSRSHDSGCNLAWNATLVYEGVQGVYVDPCSEARYAFDGTALHAGATRDLHQFRAERVTTGYVVNFEELTLGVCREGREGGCSPEGQPERRNVPRQALPAGFGDE